MAFAASDLVALGKVTVRAVMVRARDVPMGPKTILLLNLAFGLLALLGFSLVPAGPFDRPWFYPAVCVCTLLIVGTLWLGHSKVAAHLMLSGLFCSVVWSVVQTGAVHSPFMGWMHIVPLCALLTLGFEWALAWMLAALTHHGLQFVALQAGWLAGRVPAEVITVPITALVNAQILIYLFLAIFCYDVFYNKRKRSIEKRTAELEEVRRALRRANIEKDQFVTSMGHELRTPMNAILGLNSILIDELAEHADFASAATHIRDSAEQMLGVVNNILDLAQLDANRLPLRPSPCHLGLAVQAGSDLFRHRAALKGLTLHCHISQEAQCWVRVDRYRLEQVLGCLLDNAVKFTEQGRVDVRVTRRGQRTRIEVEDSGCGIRDQARAAIFDHFAHGFETTRSALAGAGLSLSLCHHLVRSLGGTMALGSKSSPGTLIWFEWPMADSVALASPADEGWDAQAMERNWRFLAVDDHGMNLTVIELALQRLWPRALVHKAATGGQALALMHNLPYDLVLMDVQMPGMDGMETTRRIRQDPNPNIRHVPVLGLTAFQQRDTLQQCLDAGMQAVLTKPVDTHALRLQIRALLTPEHAP